MALDGIILSKVKQDLDTYLPIKINRISETSKTEIVFNVLAGNKRTNLIMSFHSVFNHICLSDKNYTTYNDPSTFVMVLRKHILNGFIYKIEQFDYDRFLILHIKARNELFDEKEYLLSVELMGKYANLILIDDNNKIIDALKKIPPYENTKRTILPGAVFAYPDKQNKSNPFESNDIDFDESLVKQLQGFSKTLEQEVRFRLKSQSYDEIIKEIKESNKLYISQNNGQVEYHIIPLTHISNQYDEWELQNGFDELYYENDEKERIKNIADDLFKIVKRQLKHYQTKLVKLQESLADADNMEHYRTCGDLLYTYSNLNAKGLTEVELRDYNNELIKIKLEPKYSVKDNANRYYNQYQKKRKGKVFIEEQIEITSNELEYLNSINEQLAIANYSDALDIQEELNRYGYIKKQVSKNKKKKKVNLYQVVLDGNTITFGKNNIQNDFLTFNYAKTNYTWFHAKDYHGCHLVIDTDKPDEKAIRICANLAALYSKGRYSSSVPVNYCLVKDIKKIKGFKPGFVSIKNYKTIYIDPIEDRSLPIKSI